MASSFVKYFSEKEVKKYIVVRHAFSLKVMQKLRRAQKEKSDQRNLTFPQIRFEK
jgi:hypothetical protein